MMSRRLSLFAVALVGMMIPAGLAVAQEAKIATVNPAKVFNDMLETKDLKAVLESQRKTIEEQEKALVESVQEADKKRRIYAPGSTEATAANKEYLTKAINLQTWRELTKADLGRQQKDQMRTLFAKIEEATKEVATEKKIDLVVVDQRVELPADLEQLTVDQLRALINQRTVLFNNNKFDITDAVVSALDTKYKKPK